jgi:hypothetical protein
MPSTTMWWMTFVRGMPPSGVRRAVSFRRRNCRKLRAMYHAPKVRIRSIGSGPVILEAERLTREFYERKRRQDTWGVFRDGFLQPLLEGKPHPGLEQLARRHGFDSAMQASNAIVTAKRQFGKILRAVVGHLRDRTRHCGREGPGWAGCQRFERTGVGRCQEHSWPPEMKV